jgi:hypothetical protein
VYLAMHGICNEPICCAAHRVPDEPARFTPFYGCGSTPIQDAEEILDSNSLYNTSSLIGQLRPGLQLCLAAEVATGLLCDRWEGPGICFMTVLVNFRLEGRCLILRHVQWCFGSKTASVRVLLCRI